MFLMSEVTLYLPDLGGQGGALDDGDGAPASRTVIGP